jgi:DNA-binding NarL/FixJ family response regulator
MTVRVAIADDHAVVRAGLTALLGSADDIEVVAAVGSGAEAVAAARDLGPDVVLMDLSMPEVDGIEATRQIARRVDAPRVLVLTSFVETAQVVAALDAGASGYLLKESDPEDIVDGVRWVARGGAPLHPRVGAILLDVRRDGTPLSALTDRQLEVLSLVCEGLANKQIARRLTITERSVKSHLTAIFDRIGVQDRTQAALWATRHGLGR